jgi:hypothetical protein
VASARPVNVEAIPAQTKAVIAWDVDGSPAGLGGFRLEGAGVPVTLGAGARRHEFAGLPAGQAFVVAVIPLDGSGGADLAAAAQVGFNTLPTGLPPVGPAYDIATSPGAGSITVSWRVDEVRSITGFFVSWGDTGYVGGVALHHGERTYTIAGLRPGVTYTIDIQTFDENFTVVGATRRTVRATAG